MRIPLLVFAGLAALAASATADAQSLWQKGRQNGLSLVADNRARRIGDVVAIVIEERQKVENDETVKTDKNSDSDSGDPTLEFDEAELVKELLPIIINSDRSFEGKADYSKEGEFTAQVTAVVVDVQPNGNLLIEGKRKVTIDGEEKLMTITGIVRSFDVASDNTVESSLVANANVQYQSLGPLADNTKRGWFDRLLDFMWPF